MADFQKLQQWQEAWQTLWKTKGPPSYELTPSGDISNSGWVTELLSGVRSPAREIQRLDRIVREFPTASTACKTSDLRLLCSARLVFPKAVPITTWASKSDANSY